MCPTTVVLKTQLSYLVKCKCFSLYSHPSSRPRIESVILLPELCLPFDRKSSAENSKDCRRRCPAALLWPGTSSCPGSREEGRGGREAIKAGLRGLLMGVRWEVPAADGIPAPDLAQL